MGFDVVEAGGRWQHIAGAIGSERRGNEEAV